MVSIEPAAAVFIAEKFIGNKGNDSSNWERKVRANFGVPLDVVCELWDYIEESRRFRRGSAFQPDHLFWTLYYMKNYPTWDVLQQHLPGKPHKNTCIQYVGEGLTLLSELELIDWEDRFTDWDGRSVCLVTVDGTDFRIPEQVPFDPELYSKKFNGPGYRYEIAVCIKTGLIVWANGPFKAGLPDINIAREELNDWLLPGEMYVADGGYRDGNQWCVHPRRDRTIGYEYQKTVARARHETINGLFKNFGCCKQVFRNRPVLQKHPIVTMAAINVVQAGLIAGYSTFDVEYDENDNIF